MKQPYGTTENQKFFCKQGVTPENTSVFNAFRRFQPEKQKTCELASPHETSLFDFEGCHPMTCSSRSDGSMIAATEGNGVPDAHRNPKFSQAPPQKASPMA